MKYKIIAFIFGLVLTLQLMSRPSSAQNALLPELFEQFKYTSEQAVYEQHSYYNFTNRSLFSPDINQLGVKSIFAPPYYFGPSEIKFKLFDKAVAVDRYDWYPSESVFEGKETNGLMAWARVFPLYEGRGGIYEITLKNVSKKNLEVPIQWSVSGNLGKETNWGFYSPDIRFKEISMENVAIDAIDSGYHFVKDSVNAEMSLAGYGASYEHSKNEELKGRLSLKPGESVKTGIVFALGENDGQTKDTVAEIAEDVPTRISDIRKGWEQDLTDIMQEAPRLEGVSEQMQKFYNTGLLNLLSVKWEVPEFIFSPWLAACGIDGGAMISYLWDMALPGKFVSLLSPETTKKHILAFANAGMFDNYAVNPATGKGVGPFYSYNYYALTLLVYDYVSMTGDFSILDEPVGDGTYLDFLYKFSLGADDLSKPADLVDYGSNHNLLELRETDDYQHYVLSPNAERVLIYDMLTELYKYEGRETPHDLMQRKRELSKVFREKLWNDEVGWPNTLDQEGNPHIAYSIQIFDAIRTGVYTKEMEKAIVAHLNEKEFLSKWGVHSLSKKDPGYDPNDVDWGGPGIYTVDGPELMADLFNAGFFDEGIDLLNRITWWGDLPYYPQAMRAGSRGYREDGRANLISGVGIPMHLAFGLFRMKVTTDSLKIHPIEHEFLEGVSLKGLKLRGKDIDVAVSADGERYTVSVNGEKNVLDSGTAFTVMLD